MASEELNSLYLGSISAPLYCKVHPVVPMTIINNFLRKNEDQKRIVGTLMGNVEANVVEIKNCFVVPHAEKGGELLLDQQVYETMLEMNTAINPKENVVGFFETASGISDGSLILYNFYAKRFKSLQNVLNAPLYLRLDLNLSNNHLDINVSMAKAGLTGFALFQSLPSSVILDKPHSLGLDLVMSNANYDDTKFSEISEANKLVSNLQNLEESLDVIQDALDKCETYIDDILSKKKKENKAFGRFLSHALGSTKELDLAVFESKLNNNLQDILMVLYLSNLIRTQAVLTEKIANY